LIKIENRNIDIGERNMQTISEATTTIKEIWSYQHPVMHTWFLFSAVSIGCMFMFLFFAI
jgi:hypothetical protein